MNRPEIVTALPVAFDSKGRLDIAGTAQIAAKAAGSGVDGVLALGTTAEFVSLDIEERALITEATLQACKNIRTIVHVGGASQYEVLKLIERARSAGVRELAVLTPYYLPISDRQMQSFFATTSEAAGDCDVYVYVFPERTGNPVSPQLLARLARLPGIVGAKISGASGRDLAAYREAVGEEFVLYTGDDRQIARVAGLGGQGVVSGIASCLPRPFTELAELVATGAAGEPIAAAQAAVDQVVDVVQGDIARIKAVLRMQGIRAGSPRMPIQEPDSAELAVLHSLVEHYGRVSSDPSFAELP